jgi:hypothetical protein
MPVGAIVGWPLGVIEINGYSSGIAPGWRVSLPIAALLPAPPPTAEGAAFLAVKLGDLGSFPTVIPRILTADRAVWVNLSQSFSVCNILRTHLVKWSTRSGA